MARKKSKKIQKRSHKKLKKQKTKKKRKSGKKYVGMHDNRDRAPLSNLGNTEYVNSFPSSPFSELKNFDAKCFRIVYQPIAPDEYEKVLIQDLKLLDFRVLSDKKQPFPEQSDYIVLGTQLNLAFHKWGREKGITEHLAGIFSFCTGHFFDAMYGTFQCPLPLLNSFVLDMFLSKFLSEEKLKGMGILSYIPKSLQLFYRFLHEKGYGIYNIAKIIYDIEQFDRKIIRSYIPAQNAE